MGAWPYPRFIGHRGGGTLAPENTLAGFALAAHMGVKMVEFDVMLAGCGTSVLIHDETLERTTNGTGRVCDTPYTALSELDAGAWFSPQFAGARIPTLTEALACCQTLGLVANVEIKPAAGFERETGASVAKCVAQYVTECAAQQAPAPTPYLLSSFSLDALTAAHAAAPSLPRAVLFENLPDDWAAVVSQLDAVAVHCHAAALTPATAEALQQRGLPLACYTVNDPHHAERLFALGARSLFTDRLDLFFPTAG